MSPCPSANATTFAPAARLMVRACLCAAALLGGGCVTTRDAAIEPEIELPYVPPETNLSKAPPLPPVNPRIVNHGPRDRKLVALTFDACSARDPSMYDERVAKVLIENNVPATIFFGGKWMEEHPEHTRFLASHPQFEFANHSYLHPHLARVSDTRIQNELRWTQDIMYSLTGRRATLFRAPFGEVDEHISRVVAAEGLTTIQYDLASGDPDKRVSREKLIEYVSTMTRKGSIVVMHINRRGWHTADALPEIIANLRRRGFEFVTVSELLREKEPETDTAAVGGITPAKP